ncbi:hypothetical protein TSUD_215340 [Trifolium subterraneum]|uniref:CBM20 domain-containing protein n=1 Tax=Trifolium subterraneum TaxID=3900 RepID=A0A2Z6N4E8_TRISU|nr:hypothetical protein TSUD_215340 [Trifolium subterraneum]
MVTGNDEELDGNGIHQTPLRIPELLYVSVKMENPILALAGNLFPHVFFSSAALLGDSCDCSKALSMERESASMWELSFVVPQNHEALDFKFLLKPKDDNSPCFVEEGPNRVIVGGALQGGARLASFKLDNDQPDEYKVFVQASRVSSFDLAASWRAYKENFHLSAVRGIPDVSINSELQTESETVSSVGLELDLEHYVVPAPSNSANSSRVYAANLTENPRSRNSGSGSDSYSAGDDSFSFEPESEMKVNALDPSKAYESPRMVKSQSVGTMSTLRKEDGQRGPFVDRGVGFPRFQKSTSLKAFTTVLSLDTDTENSFPAAAGAVAAGAIADQMLGPKEDKHLAIVMYRRLKHGASQSADFFRADNPEGIEARNEVAKLAFEDMITWMQEGGQVGIFDATNSSKQRRNMLMKLAEGRCKIIFLETICNDVDMIERNIRYKIQQSPDYAEVQDFEAGLRDFKTRVYETVEEGSYIKMIDMASGRGGQIQVNNISGYLPGRIVFFLMNTHLTPRPILLTRHGESQDNVRGRIGGDPALRARRCRPSKIYRTGDPLDMILELDLHICILMLPFHDFEHLTLPNRKHSLHIWTSTLQRTILTAGPIGGFPKIQWRALDEIDAGVCDGMTYEEIKKNMPEEYESRKKDKLRYRYPRGESYLDVIQRLEPVIIELERQRAPVVVVSHQAVLRALYAYFTDRPLKEIPHMEVPLHTIIEIELGVTGVQEKRYKLM